MSRNNPDRVLSFEQTGTLALQGMRSSRLALPLAVALSLALSIAAGVSGWQRGGYWLESLLWAALSVLAVLAVHLLPALLYRRGWLSLAAVPVWLGIFAVVVFGHAQFFTLSEIHSGRERVLKMQETPVMGGVPKTGDPPMTAPFAGGMLKTEHTRQDDSKRNNPLTVEKASGRPAPVVARDLARASSALVWLPEARRPAQREAVEALRLELATVQQAEARETASLARQQASAESQQADPVGLRLGQVLGIAPGSVMLVVALATALVLELASVILWRLALVAPSQPPSGGREGHWLAGWGWRRWWTGKVQHPAIPPELATVGPDARSGHLEPEAQPALTECEPGANFSRANQQTSEPAKPEPATSSSDALAILTLLRAKGGLSLGTLQASVSKRLRPALADLLAALEQAGQIRISQQGRGRMVELI